MIVGGHGGHLHEHPSHNAGLAASFMLVQSISTVGKLDDDPLPPCAGDLAEPCGDECGGDAVAELNWSRTYNCSSPLHIHDGERQLSLA